MTEFKSIKKSASFNESSLSCFLDEKRIFGFWLYLMSDCIIFATLFAVYASICSNSLNTTQKTISSNLYSVLIETIVLLTSSITYGIATHFLLKQKLKKSVLMFLISVFLGCIFLLLEYKELNEFIISGHGPNVNGGFSAFFALVMTHGVHVFIGILWMIILIIQLVLNRKSFIEIVNNFFCLGLFWHFLDIIWICVYTFVYLIGALS